jgi:lysylphosphatidylglycerol synthetase-like protein (DUF2156 family)
LLLARVGPNLKELALAVVVATIISSPLLWWLFIVRPRRATVRRGVLAGILSVILAVFLMWVIAGLFAGGLFQGEETWLNWLFLGLIIVVAVIISPLGWFLMAIGGSVGGLLALVTRLEILKDTAEEGALFPPD